MKNLILLFTALLFINCSSDDSSNNQQLNDRNYKHVVALVDGDSNTDVSITYSHQFYTGNTATNTFLLNSSGASYFQEFDNSHNTSYEVINPNSNQDEIIQFEAYRSNDSGGYTESNGSSVGEENIEWFTIVSGETATVIYDYTQQKFIKQ